MTGSAKIISFNDNAHAIVSSAGRISTTKGSANEIYEKSCSNDKEKNINLINKILSSGHESVIEHIFFNLSFDNVSVFVEQFLIEFRLASFTVKSRRYVDFGKMGYFTPDFSHYEQEKKEKLENLYSSHMEYLFQQYNELIEAGIPKEDARFVLPYSFRSNFYCSVNARQLIKIMNEMVYGRGKNYPELVELGQSLFAQCEEKLPFLAVRKPDMAKDTKLAEIFDNGEKKADQSKTPFVSVISSTEHPEELIVKAAALNYGCSDLELVNAWSKDEKKQKLIIKELLKTGRKRELEQVDFTVIFHKISLAGITHLVRHRMQSIIIPGYIKNCSYKKYVLPESIVEAGLEDKYREVFEKSEDAVKQLEELGFYYWDKAYLLLSGMTVPVMTTINAHELYTFFRLRTCNRAQWEIKNNADQLLKLLRQKHPVLFSYFGPTCFMTGKCSEGAMTCGKMKEVCSFYESNEL